MNDLSNTPVTTQIKENGVVRGFQTTHVEGAFEVTTQYDLDGQLLGEPTRVKKFTGVELTEMSPGFQSAWGEVVANLGSEFSGALLFEEDGDTITIKSGASLIGYATSWQGSGSWEDHRMVNDQPVLLEITDASKGYQIFDENWSEIASSGKSTRTITEVNGTALTVPVEDEVNVFTSYQIAELGYAGDWASLDPAVSEITWDNVASVRVNVNSTTNAENAYRPGESATTFTNTQYEYLDAGGAFMGSSEVRDGVTEVRDQNWNVVARKADLNSALTFDEMAASLGQNWSAAWAEVAQFLPDAFKPGESGDYTTLKFAYDQWDNILVFAAGGDMVGRVSSWSSEHSNERAWNGDFAIWTHQSFTFNDTQGTNVARYEVNERYASANGTDRGTLEGEGLQVSYGAAKYSYNSNYEVIGASDVDWTEIEALYNLPAGQGDLLFATDWENDVDFVTVGTNTWKDYKFDGDGNPVTEDGELAFSTETSLRVEYFEMPDGRGWHREFLGAMEVRDGFIEIRDQNWNEVARIVDATNAMEFVVIAAEYEGFAEAWGMVGSFLPPEMAHTGEDANTGAVTALQYDLSFTADDYNIFVFDEAGNLISQVNYWKGDGDHTWTDWNGKDGAELTISESRYDYNFNDANWQSIAHAGVTKNYVTAVNGQPLAAKELHEQGVNYGYRVSKEDFINANGGGEAGEAKWNELNPNVTEITWIEVAEVEISSYENASVSHEYNDGEPWQNKNERIEFFVRYTDDDDPDSPGHLERVGSQETRDGFIEIRDENWDLIAQKADASALKSYETVLEKYGANFKKAWVAIGDSLSADFKPDAVDVNNQPVNADAKYKNLVFSFGEWNDILVFNPTNGQLIGKIDVWSGENSHERPWSKDYQISEYEGYAFKDANWNEIAQYNVDSTYASIDGLARGNLENTSEQVSYAVYKVDVSDTATWDAYGVPSSLTNEQLGQLFETDWDTDVDYVSVGTQTWTNYQFDDDGQPIVDGGGNPVTEVELSERVEYYDIKGADENGHGGYRDYLGMKQVRDGFIEVLDGNWNEVAQVVDAAGAVNFETIAANYSGFGAALAELDPYLPSFVDTVTIDGDISLVVDQSKADKDKLKFTFDDHGIYVFDNTNALSLIVNVWSQEETYFEGTAKYVVTQLNYQFKDAQYNNLAEYGNRETKVTDTAAANPVAELDRSSSNVGYTITLEEAQAAGIQLPDFNNLPDPDSAPFALESVATVTVESNTWGSHANTFREADNVRSGSAERLGFRDEYGHRLGSIEIDGSLVRVFDSRWNYVDNYVVGGADAGIGFDAFLNTDLTDAEMRAAFYELMGQVLPEFVNYKVIETSDGPDFLMQDGAIRGIVEEYDWGYHDDQEWFVYEVKDAEYRDLFRVGIGKNPDDNQAPIEPHSVFISTFEHRDQVIEQQSPEAWANILNQSEYSIQDPDFKKADVAIIETRIELIDDNENGTHDDKYSETSYRFVSENSAGKQNWDYFEIIEAAGVRSVEKSTVNGWETVEKSITNVAYFAPLADVSETGSEDDQATADAISYIFDQTAQIAPDIFEKYFGQGFDMDTQFYVNLASSTFILKDVDGDLLATGLTYERFNDGEAAMDFQIEWDFVNQDAPLVQNLYLRFDKFNEVDLTQEHSISIGERLIKNNFDVSSNWDALIAEAVPTGVEGLDPARVHTIIDRDEVIIRPFDPDNLHTLVDAEAVIAEHGGVSEIRKIVEFQQTGQEQGWEYTHNIKVQDGFTYVRVGNTVNASRAPDIGDLIKIADEAALGQIDSNLVEILNYSGLDLFTDFDVYKHDGLDTLYLTKAGSEDVVLYVTDETLSWIADGDETQAGYNIYTVAGGESVGWLEKSVPGMPLPPEMEMGDAPVPGLVYYASQFNGIEATTLSEGILSQIQSQGTPLDDNGDSRYQFDDIDTFGIGQRMAVDVDNALGFGLDAVVLNAVTLQHEIEGVNVDDNDYDDPWVGRIFIEVGSVGVKVTQLYNGEPTRAGELDEGQGSEFASLKSSLYASALTDWADYDPSASSNSETSLDSLADYSQSAQDILNETEYFKDIFGLMSVTDLGGGAARLQLGSGNQSAKIIIDDMSKQWSYQYQDTVSGFELSDASTGDFMGWLWQSNVQNWGILNAQGAATDTQILAFRVNDVLDAMPSVYASNFAALGVSTSTPYDVKDDNGNDINLPYTVYDIDKIDIRRDVHFEVDANGDPVLDGGGHPVVVADQHMILHYDQYGLFLGGVGLDLISGKTFDFDENWDGWTTSLNYGAALTAEQLSASSKVYENIFKGIVDRLPEGLLTQDQLGDLCEIDPTTQYDELVGDTYTDTVTGLDTFKSSGLQLDGYIDEVDTALDLNYLLAQSDFTNSLDAAWATKVIDFEASAAGNFAVSGYTALASDYHDSQLGSMATGATGTLVIDDAVSVTLFNTADAAGDGGNVGDDPGIATNKGNDADRGFNVTGSGDQYLEVLPGNSLSGGALFCFDELMAPVYAVSFTLMGVEETKRDVFIDVHLTDGTILRDVADKHLIDTGGYQFYGYTLDATYAQSASIEGFVVYEPHDGEGADKRDIFGIDDITVAYGDTFETLCTIDPGQDYDRFFSERYDTSDTSMPSYMSRFVSDRVELNGGVAATLSEDPDGVGVDLTSYHATVNAFADAVALMSDHLGFVVHDFEASALGNFAVSGYTAATGDRVVDQSGTMMDPMNGANGTLVTDGVLSVSLFNTGQDVSVDDPGIASHAGNDADRGFNMTISGDQYLEILPSEKGPGGALFCFDEINVPVYGFGFNFMGAEDPKRDVYIDVHMSDGSIFRETAEAHALDTGGQQYYSYLTDPLHSGGLSVTGFVLYEEFDSVTGVAQGDRASYRDIISVDDIALVVSDKIADLTPSEFVDLSVPSSGNFGFTLELTQVFDSILSDPSMFEVFKYEATTGSATFSALQFADPGFGSGTHDIVITIDAEGGFAAASLTDISADDFGDAFSMSIDPTSPELATVFTSSNSIEDVTISMTSGGFRASSLQITDFGSAPSDLLASLEVDDLVANQLDFDVEVDYGGGPETITETYVKVTAPEGWEVIFEYDNGDAKVDVFDIFAPHDTQEDLSAVQSI
ncbi:hypothetical protein N9H24_01220 [Planktomarina temperata]|nr:hypothetical protein [Planktomarina temperata]